jgi:hypothetical protein
VAVHGRWRGEESTGIERLVAAGRITCRPARLIDQYVTPLSAHLRFDRTSATTRVTSIGRKDFARSGPGRDQQPFEIRLERGETSGARGDRCQWHVAKPQSRWIRWRRRRGESAHGDRIAYGIPDVAERRAHAGQRILVVGSGHSAFNVIRLIALADEAPSTRILWACAATIASVCLARRIALGPAVSGTAGGENVPSRPDAFAC